MSESGANAEMLELFRAELDTHLPVLSDGLLALEKGTVEEGRIEGMMRAAHSIKGAARIVGIADAVRVAHGMEDCFSAAKKKEILLVPGDVDVLLLGLDALQGICMGTGVSGEELDGLLEKIAGVKEGKKAAAAPAMVAEAVVSRVTPVGVRLELPAVVDEGAVRGLAEAWAGRIIGMKAVEVGCGKVVKLTAAGMAFVAAVVREAEHDGAAVTLSGAGPEMEGVWRVLGLQGHGEGRHV